MAEVTCPTCGRICADLRGASIHHRAKHGEPFPHGTCRLDLCAEPVKTDGLCRRHYSHAIRHDGDPGPVGRQRTPGRTCSVDGCERKHDAQGFCDAHYKQWCKDNPRGGKRMDPIDRYSRYIEVQENGCWYWTGSIIWSGYGSTTWDGRGSNAHRAVYMAAVGPIPDGMDLDHVCHDPNECRGGNGCMHRRCVNPDHLEPVTPYENQRRIRRTHCRRGHAYTEANTYITKEGWRRCRACSAERARRYAAQKEAAL